MEQHEPYLLTSLIRKLTEILHEHGDLSVHIADIFGGPPLTEVEVKEKDVDLPKRVELS